jgi:hypothetical protein
MRTQRDLQLVQDGSGQALVADRHDRMKVMGFGALRAARGRIQD